MWKRPKTEKPGEARKIDPTEAVVKTPPVVADGGMMRTMPPRHGCNGGLCASPAAAVELIEVPDADRVRLYRSGKLAKARNALRPRGLCDSQIASFKRMKSSHHAPMRSSGTGRPNHRRGLILII